MSEQAGVVPAPALKAAGKGPLPAAAARAHYARSPWARPMRVGLRSPGLRNSQTTFPAKVSLSPVPAVAGQFTVAGIRGIRDTVFAWTASPP
jgi:hypothetical protein